MIQAPVGVVLINKQALWAIHTATQQLNQIFVPYLADQMNLIEELINPLSRIQKQAFHCNFSSIHKNSL